MIAATNNDPALPGMPSPNRRFHGNSSARISSAAATPSRTRLVRRGM
jgi:hypothetical protein